MALQWWEHELNKHWGDGTVSDDTRRAAKTAFGEVQRLRAAVRWALGESADENGCWFGETVNEHTKPYGWRKNLRRMAGMGDLSYDKEKRTIVSNASIEDSR